LPWLRNLSAFSSALLLLKAMDNFRLPRRMPTAVPSALWAP
jgi:hypothetical protein